MAATPTAASPHWATDGAAEAAATSTTTPSCQTTDGATEATSMFVALPSHWNGGRAIGMVAPPVTLSCRWATDGAIGMAVMSTAQMSSPSRCSTGEIGATTSSILDRIVLSTFLNLVGEIGQDTGGRQSIACSGEDVALCRP
jgi:hypothetical protein